MVKLSYRESVKAANLPTVEEKRMSGYSIATFSIVNQIINVNITQCLKGAEKEQQDIVARNLKECEESLV